MGSEWDEPRRRPEAFGDRGRSEGEDGGCWSVALRSVAAAALSVLVLVAALVLPARAEARSQLAVCATANTICFFNEESNTNPIQIYSGNVTRNTCLSVPDNLVSYIKNNTGVRWKVFKTTGCTSTEAPIYPYSQGQMSSAWDNVIGSTVRTSMTSKHAGPQDPAAPFVVVG